MRERPSIKYDPAELQHKLHHSFAFVVRMINNWKVTSCTKEHMLISPVPTRLSAQMQSVLIY